jgi:hypothetical protein
MAKDPAFLFYPGDFNTGTQFFNDEQVGKYMRLLMAQHQHGHLTEEQVIFICKSYDKQVMSKFTKDSAGLWYNERLQIETIKRKKFVESRSKNKEGKTKPKNTSFSYDSHMENENENKDLNNNKKESLSKLDVFEGLIGNNLTLEQMAMAHPGKDIKQAFEECWFHHSSSPSPPQELWEWRQKLNTWLSIKGKTETFKSNGTGKQTNAKQQHTDSLLESIKARHGGMDSNGSGAGY